MSDNVPKDLGDAVRQGGLLAVRDFISGLGHKLRWALVILLLVLFAGPIIGFIAEQLWDGFTSPFRSVWDWVTFWDNGAEPAEKVATTPAAADTQNSDEPGWFCSRAPEKWNPLC